MNFQMMSIVIGTPACPAKCPFCVLGEKPDENNLIPPKMNWRNLDVALKLANRHNMDTIVLTGYGEPTLFPKDIVRTLEHISSYGFPFVELQTNGILIQQNKEKYRTFLRKWYELGLTSIAISVVSDKYEINSRHYTPNETYMDLADLIDFLHELQFTVKLTCTCCHGLTDDPEKLNQFVVFARENKVEQVTIRPLNVVYRGKNANKWTESHALTKEECEDIQTFIVEKGTFLRKVDGAGVVYDLDGQNILLSSLFNQNTQAENDDHIYNLIFLPNGRISYDWEKEGAILL